MKRNLFMTLALSLVASTSVFAFQSPLTLAADEKPASDSSSSIEEAKAKVGEKAPDFTLPDADGRKHSLSDYKGKFVVLEWVNFGCPFVKKHYNSNNMQKLQADYTKKGVIWLSICSSGIGQQGYFTGDQLKEQIAQHHSKATVYLIDADGTVGHTYGAKATPHMFVIDKDHTLVYAGAIDDKPTADVSDVPTAKNYVREALDDAMGGKKIATDSVKAYGCRVHYKTN